VDKGQSGTIALVRAGMFVTVLVLMGVLDDTHGTPVSYVTSRGEQEPPGVDDLLTNLIVILAFVIIFGQRQQVFRRWRRERRCDYCDRPGPAGLAAVAGGEGGAVAVARAAPAQSIVAGTCAPAGATR